MTFALNQKQMDSYHEQGFLILRASEYGLLEDPNNLLTWNDGTKNWPRVPGKWISYDEKSSKVRGS